jgi:curli biogenesis system outer membrane secretion channel CsgG
MKRFLSYLATVSMGALVVVGTSSLAAIAPAIAAPGLTEEAKQERQRVVVLEFDYSATSDANYYWGYWRRGNASGVSDLVVNALVDDGTYTVIDSSLVGERRNDYYGTDVASAVEIGRELGVDYVIIGSVTEFNVETETSGGGFLGIGGSERETTANVALTARMISTADSAIVATMRGEGAADDSSTSISIGGIGSGSSSENREDELISDAVEQAVTALVEDMRN